MTSLQISKIHFKIYCCDIFWCDFVVHTEKDLHFEQIIEIRSGLFHQILVPTTTNVQTLWPHLPLNGLGIKRRS